jgi:two-component system, sensor histidine kinase and response regulator
MKNILVIEDDPFIRSNIFEVLELSGYKVYTSTNGEEGLSMALNLNPDLIICDIMMPRMDGYEVKIHLDNNPRTKSTPFIFLTANADMKELRHGMAAGADDYITKPFSISDLLQSIQLRFDKLKE